MGLKQARGVWCALAIACSVDWSVGIGRTKKKEMRRALALGGRRLGILNNNQPNSWRTR